MLTASQFDAIPTSILKLYHEYEDSVIADMVRRLVKMDYVTSSAAWQMQRVIESGAVYEDVLKKLAGFTGKSEKELADAFSAAGVKSMRFDDSIYKAAGLDPLPLNLSPQMVSVLTNGLKTTNGLMQNITRSTALSAQRQFIQASDLAYLQVSSGAFSYDQAIKAAVKGIGESGLGVVYPSGRVDKLDVAIRRTVLTGVGKTSGDLQLARASEMGQDLVETSAHIGARPAHVLWQGQVFSRSGTNKKYPDFVTSTGYGTALGLNGINCRHSFYPFFEGISKEIYNKSELESYANKMVTYNGKKMTVYEATQEQRAIERQIRSFKRQENALQAGGLDASAEAAKVRDLQAKMRSFTKQTGLSRQGAREQVVSKTTKQISNSGSPMSNIGAQGSEKFISAMSKMSGVDDIYNAGLTKRAELKEKVCSIVSEKSNVPFDRVSEFIKQWAVTSNGNDYRSLYIQKTIAEKFNVPLTEYQKRAINIAETSRKAILDKKEVLPIRLQRLFEQADGQVQMSLGEIGMSVEDAHLKIIDAIYENTQELLKNDEIANVNLYRGVIFNSPVSFVDGVAEQIETNALSSWSLFEKVAKDFTDDDIVKGAIFEITVPANRVFSSAISGSGCLGEAEVILLGNINDYATIRRIK